ncbi:sensor histidine kinase [Algoriphagus aquimarinus]|uniref:Histidine kinase n=1 Tax=Algoriphagus aquimarinus TaxID=237018 RepID=A0A1I1CGR0_9BACT|nr:histidine kinase [Algoriphagus aquimarinus]SFB61232.1 Histidine kinase [Algoriphagus aquimarinus]|tara:strand:- start:57379 stop:58404 length:1026 start_codon:yes stop_codon:yes gene_type:complete
MDSIATQHKSVKKEWIFQLIIHLLVFHFVIMDHEKGQLKYELYWYQLWFFTNYVWANLLISYVFLPKLFYRKKYLQFGLSTLLVLAAVLFIEEFLIDPFIFPDTRLADLKGVLLSSGKILSVLVALAGTKIAWDAIQRQRELDELKIMVKESELSFLNSQINPHFLFNNLNNLYSYAVEQSPKTPEIILGLSGVLRYMLYECRESTVSLTKEIDHLLNFIQLYELQIEGRGSVEFVTKNIDDEYKIAPLILNVFVENAFKHSQSGQSDQIKIAISVTVNERGELTFICQNNYLPMSSEQHGIGLENVKKRLNLLYPEQYELKINQTADEFFVSLKIKLSKT